MPPVDGVIEMHIHADPDVRRRCIDQLTLTEQCRRNGYRAIMYKCHDFCTAANAYLLRSMVSGMEVFGGIVLNLNYEPKVNVQVVPRWQPRSPVTIAVASGCQLISRSLT